MTFLIFILVVVCLIILMYVLWYVKECWTMLHNMSHPWIHEDEGIEAWLAKAEPKKTRPAKSGKVNKVKKG